jgi:hypothetical protein
MATRCQCSGITVRGVRCKRMIPSGSHCYQHSVGVVPVVPVQPVVEPVVEQVIVPTDPVLHSIAVKYVRNDEDWPDMNLIITNPKYCVYYHPVLLTGAIRSFDNYAVHEAELPQPAARRLFIFTVELVRLNKHLYAQEASIQKLFGVLFEKLSIVPYMSEYTEQLRRDVDPVYREQMRIIELNAKKLACKKKYIEHIFSRSDLGPLIALKIIDFYTE